MENASNSTFRRPRDLKVGLLGTGAIADKHAQAYRSLNFELVACSNKTVAKGEAFAARWGAKFIADYRELCRYPGLDHIDVCAFPGFSSGAGTGLLRKRGDPCCFSRQWRRIFGCEGHSRFSRWGAGITLGVVSQHRFDDSVLRFLNRALAVGPAWPAAAGRCLREMVPERRFTMCGPLKEAGIRKAAER